MEQMTEAAKAIKEIRSLIARLSDLQNDDTDKRMIGEKLYLAGEAFNKSYADDPNTWLAHYAQSVGYAQWMDSGYTCPSLDQRASSNAEVCDLSYEQLRQAGFYLDLLERAEKEVGKLGPPPFSVEYEARNRVRAAAEAIARQEKEEAEKMAAEEEQDWRDIAAIRMQSENLAEARPVDAPRFSGETEKGSVREIAYFTADQQFPGYGKSFLGSLFGRSLMACEIKCHVTKPGREVVFAKQQYLLDVDTGARMGKPEWYAGIPLHDGMEIVTNMTENLIENYGFQITEQGQYWYQYKLERDYVPDSGTPAIDYDHPSLYDDEIPKKQRGNYR